MKKLATFWGLWILAAAAAAEPCSHGNTTDVTIQAAPGQTLDSLPKVLECVARLVADKPDIERITVRFAAGVYRQKTVATFSPEFSKWDGELWLIGGGKVVISGSEQIDGIMPSGKPNQYLASLPAPTIASIEAGWSRDHGLRDAVVPPQLIVGGKMFNLATHPNRGFIHITSHNADRIEKIGFTPITVSNPSGALLAQGFFNYGWADAVRRITSIDVQQGQMTLEGPAIKYGVKPGGYFVLKGAPEFVDASGEYAVLPGQNKLVFNSAQPPRIVEVSAAGKLLEGRGVRRLTIDGLAFDGVRGTAIDLSGDRITIRNSVISNAGWTGIRLNGSGNLITDSRITHTGYSAVELVGGDRKTLTPAGSTLRNSIVRNFGMLVWSSVPGVRVEGVGNVLSGNNIANGPHSGIFYFGNDHRITGNEISFVAQLTDDVGAIYSGRDWAGRGHKVSDNFIHDVHGIGAQGATALYLDDQVSGIELSGNRIWNVDRGILLGGGRDNRITQNIVIKAKQCLRFDARGTSWQKKESQPGGQLWKSLDANAADHASAYQKYPGISSVKQNRPGYPVNNVVEHNILLCPNAIDEESRQASQIGHNWLSGNPGFRSLDALTGDRLPARSDFDIDWSAIQWPSAN